MKYLFFRIIKVCVKKKYCVSSCLTEHSFTDCSALYRIPLELLKNREQHNETLFFRACVWPFLNSLNYKTRLLAAVNFCHWRFTFLFHPGLYKSFFNHFVKKTTCKKIIFSAHFCKEFLLTKCKRNRAPSARKNVKNHNLKTRMEYSSKSSMTKVDRSKKSCFVI